MSLGRQDTISLYFLTLSCKLPIRGTYASLSPEIEMRALSSVGLHPEVVPTQIVARDRHAAYCAALARLGTAIERIALTVRHWQPAVLRCGHLCLSIHE